MIPTTVLRSFLSRCHELAATAAALGNPAVGALVVCQNEIVGEGVELARSSGDVTRHAEIEAVKAAVLFLGTSDLSNCTLVSTHEPCVMCSYVIRYHQLEQVVFETAVPAVGGVNSKFPVLTDADFWSNKSVPKVEQLGKTG